MIENLNAASGLALSVCALGAILLGWLRWVRPRLRRTREDGVAIRDAILGRDAIVDTITKKELAPALPGIGQRMATVEQALITFAQNQSDIEEMRRIVLDHAERLVALEDGAVERVVNRVDSIAAYRVMEEAMKAMPDESAE